MSGILKPELWLSLQSTSSRSTLLVSNEANLCTIRRWPRNDLDVWVRDSNTNKQQPPHTNDLHTHAPKQHPTTNRTAEPQIDPLLRCLGALVLRMPGGLEGQEFGVTQRLSLG